MTTFDKAAPDTAMWKWAAVGMGALFVAYALVSARRRDGAPEVLP